MCTILQNVTRTLRVYFANASIKSESKKKRHICEDIKAYYQIIVRQKTTANSKHPKGAKGVTKALQVCIAYHMKENKLTVHQTDERMFFLERMLRKTEFASPTHVFAPNINVDVNTLDGIEDGANVILGKCTDNARIIAENRDITLYNIMRDERFQAVNSRLTAEGALMVMIEHSVKSIADCNVLVLGFGRMGAAVAKLLAKLDISLDIATTSSLRPAYAFANKVVPMCSFDFSPYDIVINTVPLAVVSDADLMSMKKGTVYIDLASSSAVNLEYAKYLGIDADIYPALPAKTCPYSAAKAIFEYISEVIK